MAITGKGAYPFNSSWNNWNRNNTQYRKNFIFGDRDNTEIIIWSDWVFQAPADGGYFMNLEELFSYFMNLVETFGYLINPT